jgi:hypothetical protein
MPLRRKPAGLHKGQKADCLKPAQVTAIQRAFTAPRDKAGASLYAPYPYDTGITNTEGRLPGFLPTGKPGVFGPANRDLAIDIDARIQAIRANASQRLTDTDSWTNLNTFLGRGGKILFYHGVSDPWFSAFDTLNYWQRASAANGAAWREASRFYMVPGMGHCRGGDSFDDFDLLGAVVAWVEQGRTPEAVLLAPASLRASVRCARGLLCPLYRRRCGTGRQLRMPDALWCAQGLIRRRLSRRARRGPARRRARDFGTLPRSNDANVPDSQQRRARLTCVRPQRRPAGILPDHQQQQPAGRLQENRYRDPLHHGVRVLSEDVRNPPPRAAAMRGTGRASG